MSKKEEILKELEPLFERAKKNNLWFHCNYQNLWFSPSELREKHEEGRFVWGVDNWELGDPTTQLISMEARVIRPFLLVG